jgi:RNA polymerase sigma-70 factor, ECF subfamily
VTHETVANDESGRRTDPVDGRRKSRPALALGPEELAFEQIVSEHGAMIKRIAASHEADSRLAEDLVQEILFALWKALRSFRGDGSIRAFVARIATNRAVSHVKRAIRYDERGELSEQMPSSGATPEAEVAALDERARLIAAVRSLPLAHRQAVLLTLEGLSGEEVASVLGISANAVAIRIYRAKELLRARFRG